jgi:hypothetical protein
MWHEREQLGIEAKFWLENLKRNDHLKDLGLDGKFIFKFIVEK